MTSLFPSDTEVVFVREFDAPRTLVWRAWTEPDMLSRWWGPHGFSAPECHIDLRPGGKYLIVAEAPDGTRYPVSGVYLEIVERERLLMTDNSDEMPAFWRAAYNRRRDADADAAPPEILLTLTLEDTKNDGAGTKMTLSSRFEAPADRAAALDMGSEETWRQSFEKMEAVLEKNLTKTGDDDA